MSGSSVGNVPTQRPDGWQFGAVPATALFTDTFETALDTTARWTLGGSSVPTAASGVLSVVPAAAASAASYAVSKPTFSLSITAFMQYSAVTKLELTNTPGNTRFWGLGQVTAPTDTVPVTNGVGFEIPASNVSTLLGSVYSAGVRVASVTLTKPTDNAWHRYAVWFRTSRVYFELDGVVVGSINFPSPAATTLSAVAVSVNSSAGTGQPTFQFSVLGIADSNANNSTISDGTNPWRKATVNAGGDLATSLTSPASAALGIYAGLLPWGAQDVMSGAATLLYDSWSAGLDTTDKWAVTGSAPTLSLGVATPSATVSTYNALRSKDVFKPNVAFLQIANGIALETTAATGAGRFWGAGTVASSPSATSLVQDGVGFEVDQATGALYTVTYAAGVRTITATLAPGVAPAGTNAVAASTVPNFRDGANHRFTVYHRVTNTFWLVDNVLMASASFANVQVAELPAIMVRYNAASYTGTPVFTNTAHFTADTSRQGVTLVDPVVGARQARVDPFGAQYMRKASAGTGTITSVTATAASTQLLAANANRLGATVTNDSTATLYLALSGSASTTAYTVQLPGGTYYELPNDGCGYVGPVYGIWAAANGAARVTELTP